MTNEMILTNAVLVLGDATLHGTLVACDGQITADREGAGGGGGGLNGACCVRHAHSLPRPRGRGEELAGCCQLPGLDTAGRLDG